MSYISNGSNFITTIPQGQLPLTDSGFSSAVPSIIDDEHNIDEEPSLQFTSYDWDDNYWDATMHFQGDSLPKSSSNGAFQPQPQPQTTPEPMSPVSVPMMDLSKPTSSDMASQAIPTLIDLLADEDPVVQSKASNMVLQISQEKSSRDTISNSPAMVAALLEVLSKTNNMEIIENGVGVLYNLSEYRQGRLTIYKFGGIVELVRMLSFNSESIIHLAITALHLLLLYQEGAKEAVRSANGLPFLVSLLSNQNEQFLSIVTDCIRLLAYGDSDTKLKMQRLGGTMKLVQILQSCTYSNLLWVTCSTLKVLSACPENKRVIIEGGGLQALAMHLNIQVDSHVSNCLFTVRNLSDAAVAQDNLHPLLSNVMNILSYALKDDPSKHENTVTCVAGILSNLTCNVTNKQIVRQMGGVEILIETIKKFGSKEEVTEPAVCALRHLTCRYPEAELASDAIRHCQGLAPIINLLNSCSWPLRKAVVGLLRNLALCDANIVPLREHFAIQKLAAVLSEAQTTDLSTGGVPMGTPFITDPKIAAIIEEARATLNIMAKDPYIKQFIDENPLCAEDKIYDTMDTTFAR